MKISILSRRFHRWGAIAVGLPLTAWGLHRRSGGWTTAGALLLAHGTLGLARWPVSPLD